MVGSDLEPLAFTAPHQTRHPTEVLQQLLDRTGLLVRQLALDAQEKHRLLHQPLPSGRPSLTPGRPELLDLPVRQLLTGDRRGQPLAVLAIRLGHRHQGLHRPLNRDPALPHVLLDRRRERLDQRQAARHPAAATAQTPRQLLAAPPLTPLQLTQQPPHLQRRLLRAPQAVADQQRLFLADPQHQGLHRVPPQTFQRSDPPVAIDDPEPLQLPSRTDHHDRQLLAVLFQRTQQRPLRCPIADP